MAVAGLTVVLLAVPAHRCPCQVAAASAAAIGPAELQQVRGRQHPETAQLAMAALLPCPTRSGIAPLATPFGVHGSVSTIAAPQRCCHGNTWRPDPCCCYCCCCCRCLCLAFASTHSTPEHRQPQAVPGSASDRALQPSTQAKYDRILAFVDAHATPVVLDSSWSSGTAGGSCSSSRPEQLEQDPITSSWHHSYDEEAEEGEELHEPAVLAYAASVPAAVAESAALSSSWSYGNPVSPKPFFYAWDEEAEGAFELDLACSTSACDVAAAMPADPVAAAAALRSQRRAALHEARHVACMAHSCTRSWETSDARLAGPPMGAAKLAGATVGALRVLRTRAPAQRQQG